MLAQSLRVSRTTFARHLALTCQRRAFIAPTACKLDIVRDLYLNGLKEYRPSTAKASDSEGQVKKWAAPTPPPSPSLMLDGPALAEELKAYETQTVEIEGQGGEGGEGGDEDGAREEDWFEEEANFGDDV